MRSQKKYTNLLWLFLLLLFPAMAFAQDVTVKGTVTDGDSGEPIPFANVSVNADGTTYGGQTDFDGNFNFKIPSGEHTIVFTFVGYATKEVTENFVSGDVKTYAISLAEESELLDQVVVTGGKFEQKLGEQTVSLEVIKPSLIENNNNTAVDQAIEKVPGVDVIDGQANIRGGSGYSYGAGSRVMLLMDNLPILTADAGFPNWDFLPIENLDQVEIIKGAASALYGSSAMNGIINLRTAYPKKDPEAKVTFFTGIYQNPRDNKTGRYVKELDADGVVVDSTEIEKAWWGDQFPFEAGASFAYRKKFGQFDLVTGGYLFAQDAWRQTQFSRRARLNANMRYRVKKTNRFFGGT